MKSIKSIKSWQIAKLTAFVAILLLISSCCKKQAPYLKPEPINVYWDKYVLVPNELTSPCTAIYELYPRWKQSHTFSELYLENRKTIDLCNLKLKLIKNIPIPSPKKNNE